jgi:hypothetical protein
MKGKLVLDTFLKAIFTVYFVQMLRFETESTLQILDYHIGALSNKVTCDQKLSFRDYPHLTFPSLMVFTKNTEFLNFFFFFKYAILHH